MSIVYGYTTQPTNDPYVEYAEQGTRAIAKAVDPKRAALLRLFPFRRSHRTNDNITDSFQVLRLPTWVPGSFKAEAAEAKKYATGFRRFLFGMALDLIVRTYRFPSE